MSGKTNSDDSISRGQAGLLSFISFTLGTGMMAAIMLLALAPEDSSSNNEKEITSQFNDIAPGDTATIAVDGIDYGVFIKSQPTTLQP